MSASFQYELKQKLLTVRNVSKSLGGTQILRDLSFEIRNIVRPDMKQGQVVALLGPSGIGKTTLFRLLAGMEKPDAGEVLVGEAQTPVKRGMVGVVAQHYPLFNHRTVLSNLLVAGSVGGQKSADIKARATELLSRFDLSDHGSKYPCQLSGGQRQRVAIAQQFMCSEHFLLMDEPFSGLDLIAISKVCHFINEMALMDEENTFIIVTHDVAAAMEVADHILLMGRDRDEQGRIIPGASIKASFDLIERGLAWHDSVTLLPEFLETMREIRAKFQSL